MAKFRIMILQEVAHALRVSVKTIRRWIKTGRLRALKLNGAWRVIQNDFNRFVQGRVYTGPRQVWIRCWLFKKSVLDKYGDKQKYRLIDEAFSGTVSNRRDHYKWKKCEKLSKDDFVNVHYIKLWSSASSAEPSDGDDFAVAVEPKEKAKIPPRELAHWYRFKI